MPTFGQFSAQKHNICPWQESISKFLKTSCDDPWQYFTHTKRHEQHWCMIVEICYHFVWCMLWAQFEVLYILSLPDKRLTMRGRSFQARQKLPSRTLSYRFCYRSQPSYPHLHCNYHVKPRYSTDPLYLAVYTQSFWLTHKRLNSFFQTMQIFSSDYK